MAENLIEQKILEMLQNGACYSEIESSLGVSSKTIAKVNKLRKAQESTNDGIFDQPLTDDFPEKTEETSDKPISGKHYDHDIKIKTNNMETTESENSRRESKSEVELRLEELRIKQDHELKLKQFDWNKEKEEKELNLKAEEIKQKQQQLDLEQNRTNEKYKEYIFKLKTIADRCNPDIWNRDDLVDLYNDAEKLYNKAEKFFFVHALDFDHNLYKTILDAICDTLDELLDQCEEDEEINWEFDDQFEEVLELVGKL